MRCGSRRGPCRAAGRTITISPAASPCFPAMLNPMRPRRMHIWISRGNGGARRTGPADHRWRHRGLQKSWSSIRRGRERGLAFRCVMTAAAPQFVTPLSVASLAGEKVYQDLFSLTDEAEMGHIRLSREADLVVVAPGDRRPDGQDGGGPGRRSGLDAAAGLRQAGADGPGDEPADVGSSGDAAQPGAPGRGRGTPGRARIPATWPAARSVPAGWPSRTRSWTRSSWRWPPGAAVGRPQRGGDQRPDPRADRSGPLPVQPFVGPAGTCHRPGPGRGRRRRHPGQRAGRSAGARRASNVVNVETAREMLAAVEAALPVDIAVFAAAVADWRPAATPTEKIKKREGEPPPTIELVENPDILRTVATARRPPRPGDRVCRRDRRSGGHGPRQARAQGMRLDSRQRRLARQRRVRRRSQPHPAAHRRRTGWNAWPELDKLAVARRLVQRIARAARRGPGGWVRSGCRSSACRMPRTCHCPAYATAGAAGLDLLAAVRPRPIVLEPRCACAGADRESGWRCRGIMRPRSAPARGWRRAMAVTVLNSPGTIDQDYRGEVGGDPDQSRPRTLCGDARPSHRTAG